MPVNIYGFKRHAAEEYDKAAKALTCSICHVALIGDSSDALSMICPRCGTRVLEKDAQHNLGIQSKFSGPSGTKIMQPSRKTKLRAEDGSKIPDDDLVALQDLKEGRKILSYYEEKVDESKLPSYRPKKWLT